MSGFHVVLIAEEQLHSVPWELRAERIADKQRIQSFRSGAACETSTERALSFRRGICRFDELFRSALGDCCRVLEDSHLSVYARVAHVIPATAAKIPILRPSALLSSDDSGFIGHRDAAALVDFFFARPAPLTAILC